MSTSTQSISVVPYNPDWPCQFAIEAEQIKAALGSNCIALHHIGSTSIPGLVAKPIIDIMGVVEDINTVDTNLPLLKKLGFEPKGENGILFRRFFQKSTKYLAYHFHIFEQGNPEIERHLNFRNWMRTHIEDAKLYGVLKQELAQRFANDRLSYNLGKEQFIADIDIKAGWQGFRVVHVSKPNEWEAYHRIRESALFAPRNISYDRNHPSMTADNQFHFVLYKGMDIVVAAQVEWLEKQEAALRSLATDNIYQGQGFGSYLLQQLERWIKQQGRHTIKLHAALPAVSFYRKRGYIDMVFDDIPLSQKSINLGKRL